MYTQYLSIRSIDKSYMLFYRNHLDLQCTYSGCLFDRMPNLTIIYKLVHNCIDILIHFPASAPRHTLGKLYFFGNCITI